MRYRVIKYFIDLQNGEHPYNVGDAFPYNGAEISEARIKELSGNKNKQGTPLIELVEDEPVTEKPVRTKKEVKNESASDSDNAKSKPRKKK